MGDTARVPGSWLQLGPGMVVAAIPGENQQTEDSSVPSLCCSAYQENKNMIRVEIQKKQFTGKKKLETLSACKIFTYIGQHTKIPKHVNNNIGKLWKIMNTWNNVHSLPATLQNVNMTVLIWGD